MTAPSPVNPPSPLLSAVMCDGMGWFSKIDFKRMLLLYDRILYLVPSRTVQFRDLDGSSKYIVISPELQELGFQFQHYAPDGGMAEIMFRASVSDAGRSSFAAAVAGIPEQERLYTWRVANADADLGGGSSIALHPDQDALAHGLLLNKFLIAADHMDAVPITGKQYIHALICDKYKMAQSAEGTEGPFRTKPFLHPFAIRVIQALVPDAELERRSEAAIVEYKDKHRKLFERFSYAMRKLVTQVSGLPGTDDFDRQVSEIINTEIWRDKTEAEQELRSAWGDFFKSALKSTVAGAVALGITPFLSLGSLGLASVLAGAAAASPWATAELIKILEKRRQAGQHGVYYLMNFYS